VSIPAPDRAQREEARNLTSPINKRKKVTSGPPDSGGDSAFIRRTLIVLTLTTLFFLVWHMRSILLLVFGAVLVCVIFRAIADPIRRLTRAPDGLAVAIAVMLVIGILGFAFWMFGSEVSGQVRRLSETLPDAWRTFERRLGDMGFGGRLDEMMEEAEPSGSGVLSGISRFAMSLGGGIADALVVLVGGIYLAAQPGFYREGLLKLVPQHRRDLAGQAMNDSGKALRLWLKGQLIAMSVVGLLVGAGLWLIGIPSALALGILAGILEFIPLAGPIIAAIPALLIALADGPQTALWVLGLYIVVQQIEGNLLQPIVQQHAVDLPAFVLIFSLLGFAMLFGVPGIILAAPLAVVGYVLVKRLYVQEALDTRTSIPGSEE
jgi:predicted PurR-regulated permease PerM